MAVRGSVGVQDPSYKTKDIPLNGKYITSKDGLLIAENDFQELQNLRYTDTNVIAIGGMTKINTSAPSYIKHRSSIQFDKISPNENHVIIQSYNAAENASVIQEMVQEIPNTGNFEATTLFSVATTWTANTAYAIGALVFPTTKNGMYYECIITGTSHAATEPTWTTTEYTKYVDGTANWIGRKGDLLGKFSKAPDGCVAYANGKHTLIYGGNEFRCASLINFDYSGSTFSYDYTDRITNDLSTTRYTAVLKKSTDVGDTKTYAYIGSTLPWITGVKFYINSPNATACTVLIEYWTGASWATVGAVTDGTSVGGKSMAQTGRMTFGDNARSGIRREVNNLYLYWIRLTWSDLDNTTSIYKTSLKTAMQNAVDEWDGSDIPIVKCLRYTVAGGYEDNTTNVIVKDTTSVYDSSIPAWVYAPETYLNMGSFLNTGCIYIGSISRVNGFYINLPADQINTTGSVMTVYYWTGTAWTSVGSLNDGTNVGGVSLTKSGYVLWTDTFESLEFQTSVSSTPEMYFYKIDFTVGLSANCKIDYISIIPSSQIINDYNFPVMWLNRLFYCGNKSKDKNKIIGSASYAPTIFSGSDYIERYLGTNEDLVAGTTLFSRYGTQISETLIIAKTSETYVIDGTSQDDIVTYAVSRKYGCVAPMTMQTCDLGFEIAPGINKAVVIWQSNSGMVMFDNGSIICIDMDIEDKFQRMFDTGYSTRLNGLYANISNSFYDPVNKEYHWLYASGSSTTINSELVFDITKKKWYAVDRGTYPLMHGLIVVDTKGNYYNYGTIDTGYVERLEYGNDFDGSDIVCTLRTADKPLYKSMMEETKIRHVKVVGVGKLSSDKVSVYHYVDTNLIPETLPVTINQNVVSTKRLYQTENSLESNGVFHSFKLSLTIDDCYRGFEPLAIGILFKVSRYDTIGG